MTSHRGRGSAGFLTSFLPPPRAVRAEVMTSSLRSNQWPLNRAFTISASLCSAYLLAMGLICMAQRGFRRSVLEGEIALGVARPSSSNTGVHALDLVYRAAGVFRNI